MKTPSLQEVKDMIDGGMITNTYDVIRHCEAWGFSKWDTEVLRVYMLHAK